MSDEEFLGLDARECCVSCTNEHCVISQRPYCAHPRKCGLQAIDRAEGAKVRRYNEAVRYLAIQEARNMRVDV